MSYSHYYPSICLSVLLVAACGGSDNTSSVPNDNFCPDIAEVQFHENDCTLFGTILFEAGSDKLTDTANTTLSQVADVMLMNTMLSFEVQSHADNMEGTAEATLELSKKRAVSAVAYLISVGAPSDRLSARAFGDSNPAQSNETIDPGRMNRRVEFKVLP